MKILITCELCGHESSADGTSNECIDCLKYQRLQLAKLAADTPQFDNPIQAWAAKDLRDRVLKELRDKANAENAARDSVTRSSETPVPSELDRMATEALAAHARGETIALPTRSTSGRRAT